MNDKQRETVTDNARATFDARFKHYDGYKSPARQDDLFRVFRSGMEYGESLSAGRAETTTETAEDVLSGRCCAHPKCPGGSLCCCVNHPATDEDAKVPAHVVEAMLRAEQQQREHGGDNHKASRDCPECRAIFEHASVGGRAETTTEDAARATDSSLDRMERVWPQRHTLGLPPTT